MKVRIFLFVRESFLLSVPLELTLVVKQLEFATCADLHVGMCLREFLFDIFTRIASHSVGSVANTDNGQESSRQKPFGARLVGGNIAVVANFAVTATRGSGTLIFLVGLHVRHL